MSECEVILSFFTSESPANLFHVFNKEQVFELIGLFFTYLYVIQITIVSIAY